MLGVALSVAAAAAAAAAGYQSMAPWGQWYGRTFTGLKGQSKKIALTYDDGPNDPYTPQLMDVLAKHNVRATFFLIGRFVTRRPNIVRQLVSAGHVVGNHTYTHPPLIFETSVQVRIQLTSCRQVIEDAVGKHSSLFRPPYGGRRPAVFRIARELGLEPVMWNTLGYDWLDTTPQRIEQNVAKSIRGGDVVLLHDGGHKHLGTDRSKTVAATDLLVSRYKAQGYEFVTVPEMMQGWSATRQNN
jgi:peptidoglycan/xylan/chitin deacetylase (PgdA/CDA1 family)